MTRCSISGWPCSPDISLPSGAAMLIRCSSPSLNSEHIGPEDQGRRVPKRLFGISALPGLIRFRAAPKRTRKPARRSAGISGPPAPPVATGFASVSPQAIGSAVPVKGSMFLSVVAHGEIDVRKLRRPRHSDPAQWRTRFDGLSRPYYGAPFRRWLYCVSQPSP